MKIYLATAATATPAYQALVERVLVVLRENENDVYSELEQSGWKPSTEPMEMTLRRKLDGVSNADMILVLGDGLPTAEMEFIIGYSVAKEKRLVVAKPVGDDPLPINSALIANGQMTLVQYDTLEALAAQLTITVNAPEA